MTGEQLSMIILVIASDLLAFVGSSFFIYRSKYPYFHYRPWSIVLIGPWTLLFILNFRLILFLLNTKDVIYIGNIVTHACFLSFFIPSIFIRVLSLVHMHQRAQGITSGISNFSTQHPWILNVRKQVCTLLVSGSLLMIIMCTIFMWYYKKGHYTKVSYIIIYSVLVGIMFLACFILLFKIVHLPDTHFLKHELSLVLVISLVCIVDWIWRMFTMDILEKSYDKIVIFTIIVHVIFLLVIVHPIVASYMKRKENINLISLVDILRDDTYSYSFDRFCVESFCQENLLFLKDVKCFVQEPSVKGALDIINMYIAKDSIRMINIPHELLINGEHVTEPVDSGLFILLERHIRYLLTSDVLPRWREKQTNTNLVYGHDTGLV